MQVTAARRGPATLDRVGQVPLPVGAVRDGEVGDRDAVVDALRSLWSRHGFKGRKVQLGLANQQVVVRQIDLPTLPEADMRRSLPFQVQDSIPIPVEQAILDYHRLGEWEGEDGQSTTRLLLIAAQRQMVEAIMTAVRRAKLVPVGLDLDAFPMLRSLAPPAAVDDVEGQLVLDLGAAVTNVVVQQGGVPHFVGILLMGGDAITEALMS
nr:pilus assembly protein PilM [Euzebyales bacterium]